MAALKIISAFTPRGGEPDVIASREPNVGDLVRIEGANGAVEIPWTAPMFATPTGKPKLLSPNQVLDLMVAEAGIATVAACLRSDHDSAVVWREKMRLAAGREITKVQAATGLQALVGASLLTARQRTAVLAAWPVG